MSAALDKAIARLMNGRLEEARRSCRKVLEQDPDQPQSLLLLAEIYRRMGDEKGAAKADARVLDRQPGWTPAHLASTVGALYEEFDRPTEATERYRRALELDPRLGEALDGLVRLRRFAEVERFCRESMARFPGESLYPEKLGAALGFLGRYEEAVEAYGAALERAATLEAKQRAGFYKAGSLLALGRYAEGWASFGSRPARADLRTAHPEIVEDPAALASLTRPAHIRIHLEQGLGDEIFFLRFAPLLRARGHRLSLKADAKSYDKLTPLLSALPQLFDAASDRADAAICSGDLALASGQAHAPPLALPVDEPRRERLKGELEKELGPPPYIGVTWRAGVLPDEPKPQGLYLVKEVPPEHLAKAIAPCDARVVILQRRPTADDVQQFERGLGRKARDLSRVNDDLRDALALLSLLDEYVGVSNTNTHLRAGLPGRPARVLLGMPSEWRWGLQGASSPWFPGFTLYRRRYDEDWSAALRELRQDLAKKYAAAQ